MAKHELFGGKLPPLYLSALMEGADIYQITKNCHTNVDMIEKHYASQIKNSISTAAVNVRRPKKKKG